MVSSCCYSDPDHLLSVHIQYLSASSGVAATSGISPPMLLASFLGRRSSTTPGTTTKVVSNRNRRSTGSPAGILDTRVWKCILLTAAYTRTRWGKGTLRHAPCKDASMLRERSILGGGYDSVPQLAPFALLRRLQSVANDHAVDDSQSVGTCGFRWLHAASSRSSLSNPGMDRRCVRNRGRRVRYQAMR